MKKSLLLSVLILAVSATPAAAFATKFFQSPSNNIGCEIVVGGPHIPGEARCDIKKRKWHPGHKPASCHLDYGSGLFVGSRGKAGYTCAGDTIVNQGNHLNYGHSVSLGNFKCTSRTSGITCNNTKTHHGFKISQTVDQRY